MKRTPLRRKTGLQRSKPLSESTKAGKTPVRASCKTGQGKKKKPKARSLTKAAEMYARQACLHRWGHRCCAAGKLDTECGTIPNRAYVEWAHIHGRRASPRLKFHPDGAIILCPVHHDYLDSHPAVKSEFLEELIPGIGQKLAELERILPKWSAKDWCEYYRSVGFTTTGRRKT